jgi:ABC-type proline/glycine betaine transport system permease subunit
VLGLLLALWSPFTFSLLGLGLFTGGITVAASVCLLALAFTASTLFGNWHAPSLGSQLVAGARTLAVASSLLAAGVGVLGGGGLGPAILTGARLMEYGLMWKGLLVMLVLALVCDVTFGLMQILALQHSPGNAEIAVN